MTIQLGQLEGNVLTLPPEIARKFEGATQILVVEEKDGIFLKAIAPPRRTRFTEVASNLDRLDEEAPLTEEEIEIEVHAHRAEKRVRGCG